MPKLIFQWNSSPKLKLGAEVHRLVPKSFRAEVTRAEHRLPLVNTFRLQHPSPTSMLPLPKSNLKVADPISDFLPKNQADKFEKIPSKIYLNRIF